MTLLGTVIAGIVVTNQIQLGNASGTELGQLHLWRWRPDLGNAFTDGQLYHVHLQGYVSHRLQAISHRSRHQLTIYLGTGQTSTDLDQCSANKFVEVDASMIQFCIFLCGDAFGNPATKHSDDLSRANRFVLNEINPVKRRSGQSLLEYSVYCP